MTHPLECHQLTKLFNGQTILSNVSLTVRAGQLLALLGHSGCGKTTTLRLIAGFDWPDSGTIRINGREVAGPKTRVPAEDRQVGMVFQEYALFPHLNTAENIAFGLKLRGRERDVRVREMLTLVGLDGYETRMPAELSGGQQQRVALARALAPRPAILLLDEPFSNLDAAMRGQVRAEVRSILKQAGTTCIFVTHDQHEALSLADEVAVMMNGRVAQLADPHTLYHHPVSAEIAAFVGEANFLPGLGQGDLVQCSLGSLPLVEPASGQVRVLVRPESLRLSGGAGTPATVQWREFYGHDQRVGILLDDGTTLAARLDTHTPYEIGQRVSVTVASPVRAFT